MILPTNKLSDKRTGVVVEFMPSSLSAIPQQVWQARGNLSNSDANTTTWFSNEATPPAAVLTASIASVGNWVIPKLYDGQVAIAYHAHFQHLNGNSFKIGDTAGLSGYMACGKRSSAIYTDDSNGITLSQAPFANNVNYLHAAVIDLTNPIFSEKFVIYTYDFAGNLVYKNDTGVLDGTLPEAKDIDFTTITSPETPFSIDTAELHYGAGMAYFNERPADLFEGLVSMSLDVGNGFYDPWR